MFSSPNLKIYQKTSIFRICVQVVEVIKKIQALGEHQILRKPANTQVFGICI